MVGETDQTARDGFEVKVDVRVRVNREEKHKARVRENSIFMAEEVAERAIKGEPIAKRSIAKDEEMMVRMGAEKEVLVDDGAVDDDGAP